MVFRLRCKILKYLGVNEFEMFVDDVLVFHGNLLVIILQYLLSFLTYNNSIQSSPEKSFIVDGIATGFIYLCLHSLVLDSTPLHIITVYKLIR